MSMVLSEEGSLSHDGICGIFGPLVFGIVHHVLDEGLLAVVPQMVPGRLCSWLLARRAKECCLHAALCMVHM